MTSWICLLVLAATPASAGIEKSASVELAAKAAATTSPAPLTAAAPGDSSNPPQVILGDTSKESATNRKPARELRKELHESLRSAAVESGAAREVAIRRLVSLYGELVRDTQFTDEDRLAALRLVRNRLRKISDELTKAARKTGANKNSPVAAAADAQGGDEIAVSQAKDPIQAGMRASARPARGGAQTADDGEALLDLIQRTIAPQTWDVNGGLGVIRYYASGQALVVRQTGDAHDNLSDVLGQLRK